MFLKICGFPGSEIDAGASIGDAQNEAASSGYHFGQ